MSSDDKSFNLFLKEAEKLNNALETWMQNYKEISMAQIVELYYQVINVNSLVKYSQNSYESSNEEINVQISNSQKIIEEKFNNNLHPKIFKKIEELIETTKNDLKKIQSQNKKTKEEIEKQAEKYEELRKIMSTKEFVDQYNKLIDNQ